MERDAIIRTLRLNETALRGKGVTHAAVFGSVARGESRADSDIDIVVDLDPHIVRTMIDYSGVKELIASLFDGPVDVVSREALKPLLRPNVAADAVYAF